MALSKRERLARVHQEARSLFEDVQTTMRDERLQCLQDRRFYSIAGAQWEGNLESQFENKPRFELNKTHLAVIRIINEYRNNNITVRFVTKDGGDDKFTEVCAAIFRADEQDSNAEEAYDNAFEEAVGGGFGAIRLRGDYEDDEDDEDDRQRIYIEPITDADSTVFFDLNAKRQDKSDATHCWVLTAMSRDAYETEYDDDPDSWPKEIFQTQFDWATPDIVYVAEYYVVEETKETISIYQGLNGEIKKVCEDEIEEDPDLEDTLEATGFYLLRTKKVTKKKVHKYIMSGGKILEDCGYIAGKYIPIIPVYGKRWFVDNVERCMGHVRLPKDAQRLKNMQISKVGEIASLSSVEKPIFYPEQIAQHQVMWAEDNIKNYPYLLINPIYDAGGNLQPGGPIAYTRSPSIPPAMAALLQMTEEDLKDLLGNQEAGEEIQPNISGIAIELIQNRLDMQAFIYISNFAKAIKHLGKVWLSMARDLYVEKGRKMKGVGDQDEVESHELMQPMLGNDGETEYQNDFANAKFEPAVTVGPSSISRRQSTVRNLVNIMSITQDPETLQVLNAMVMMNMEGEGIEEVRNFFRRKLIKMGVVEPTKEESKELEAELANTPPDPNAQFLAASAKQAEAEAVKANADTVLTVAKTGESKAKAAESLANIQINQRAQLLDTVQTLASMSSNGETPSSSQE